MDRRQRILEGLDRAGLGLEIGPSHSPVAPRSEGFRVEVIDHADRDALVAKYGALGVDTSRIENVDHVWDGRSYVELTGKPRHYDWVIASHVIEHVPDLIAFLRNCDEVLRDGGVLSLAVPDKRYCFDRFRPHSGLAQVVDEHLADRRASSPGKIAEFYSDTVLLSGDLAWDATIAGVRRDFSFIYGAERARAAMAEARNGGGYNDVHAWCFTPSSFRLLVEDLYQLGLQPLREARFSGTQGSEFYVALARNGQGHGLERLQLLQRIEAELAASSPAPARRPLIRGAIGRWLRRKHGDSARPTS